MTSFTTMASFIRTDGYYMERVDENANIIIGAVTLVTSIALIFLQSSIFIIFKKNPTLSRSISFVLMRHLGISEIIQQICHLFSSFYALFLYKPDNFVGQFVASLLQTGYLVSITFLLILTINRFDVIFNRKIFISFNREKFFKFCVISNYIWGMVLVVFFMIPDFQLHYSLLNFGWQYVAESPNWLMAKVFENRYVIIILCCCFITYVIIIGKILQMKSYAGKGASITFSEISLLLQAIFNFLFIVLVESCWSFLYLYLPQTKYSFTIVNYLYVLSSGTNAVVSLLFIKELRLGFLKIICNCKKKSKNEIKTIKVTSLKSKT